MLTQRGLNQILNRGLSTVRTPVNRQPIRIQGRTLAALRPSISRGVTYQQKLLCYSVRANSSAAGSGKTKKNTLSLQERYVFQSTRIFPTFPQKLQ